MDLSNEENKVNYERNYLNNNLVNRNRAVKQQFGGAAASEAAGISESNRNANIREKNIDEANQVAKDRDAQYLELMKTKNWGFDENINPYFTRTYQDNSEPVEEQATGNAKIKVKKPYTYKSGTKYKKK